MKRVKAELHMRRNWKLSIHCNSRACPPFSASVSFMLVSSIFAGKEVSAINNPTLKSLLSTLLWSVFPWCMSFVWGFSFFGWCLLS